MRKLPIAVLAAVLLAGCGGGAGATNAPAGTSGNGGATVPPVGGGSSATQNPVAVPDTVDACKFLTVEDITEVTGLAIKSSAKAPQFGIFGSACGWDLVNDAAMVAPSIALGIMTSGGRSNYDKYFGPYYDDFGYEPLEGLGDTAADAGAGSVLVVSGDALFELQYLAMRDNDTEMATALARKVIANLGK